MKNKYLKEIDTESLKEYNSFMKMYRKQHEVCPKCGAKEHTTTLMGYPIEKLETRIEITKTLANIVNENGEPYLSSDWIKTRILKI
jgi:hypothetical protein